jgi:hypothetical protein
MSSAHNIYGQLAKTLFAVEDARRDFIVSVSSQTLDADTLGRLAEAEEALANAEGAFAMLFDSTYREIKQTWTKNPRHEICATNGPCQFNGAGQNSSLQ